MDYIKFYLRKSFKWIIYNSIGLSIVLFCVYQLYGGINHRYFEDSISIIKREGAFGYNNDIEIDKINKLSKVDKFRNISYIVERPKFEKDEEFYNIDLIFYVLFGDDENIIDFGENIKNSDKRKVVVPIEYFNSNGFNLGDTIKIANKDFSIIGVSNYNINNAFIISYEDYKELGLETSGFFIRANEDIKKEEINDFINSSKKILNDESLDIVHPQNDLSTMYDDIILGVLIFILGLISLLSLYRFTIYKKKKLINIFILSGLNKRRLLSIEYISLAFTFVIGFVLSILFSRIFNIILMPNIFNISNYTMHLINYIYVFLVFLFIYIFSMHYVFNRNFSIYISKNIKESDL